MAVSAKQILSAAANAGTANPFGIAKSVIGAIANNRTVVDVGNSAAGQNVDAVSGAAYQPSSADYARWNYLNLMHSAKGALKGSEPDPGPYDPGSASGGSPTTPQQLQYVDAPYAEMYGMDISTAYQEALANTAYQRKVNDLRAAGLNPVLGYSGAGAASFYGTPDAGVSFSGGVSYGSSGSGKTTSRLTSKQQDTLLRNLPNAIGGIVSIVKGPSAGAATSAIGNAVSNIIRYW